MIKFSEFKPIPKILCGISSTESVKEAISVPDYTNYIGDEAHDPEKLGYKKYIGDVYKHPNHPDKAFIFSGSQNPIEFDSVNDAIDHEFDVGNSAEEKAYKLHQSLSKHYSSQKFNKNHQQAIRDYSETHSNINDRLLQGNLESHHNTYIGHLDDALSKVKTPDDMVVYTGTNKEHADIVRNNPVVAHPSFLSASLMKKKAVNFAREKDGDVIAIHLPKESSGAYIGHMSSNSEEYEFMLPRNKKLQIDHSKRQFIRNNQTNRLITIHHATLI